MSESKDRARLGIVGSPGDAVRAAAAATDAGAAAPQGVPGRLIFAALFDAEKAGQINFVFGEDLFSPAITPEILYVLMARLQKAIRVQAQQNGYKPLADGL